MSLTTNDRVCYRLLDNVNELFLELAAYFDILPEPLRNRFVEWQQRIESLHCEFDQDFTTYKSNGE